jgi:hypothetical protein
MTGMRFVWRCLGVALWVVVLVWGFNGVGSSGEVDCGSAFSPDFDTSAADDDGEGLDVEAFVADCRDDVDTSRFLMTLVALAATGALVLSVALPEPVREQDAETSP